MPFCSDQKCLVKIIPDIVKGLSGAQKKNVCAQNVEICQNEGKDESFGLAFWKEKCSGTMAR